MIIGLSGTYLGNVYV